jgi:NadR type nicotinamide-nucleotide adenylyltransferase
MNAQVKKIALIGPESSGKTTLCKALAAYFGTEWVPEFARNYVASLERKYTLEDIEYCTREQVMSEEIKMQDARGFLFCDSELIIAKVWCEDVFKTVPAWIEEMIGSHRYDLFLLTLPDLPFQADNVRENPYRRDFFFEWYMRELDERKFTREVIEGNGETRFSNALEAIRKHFPGL